MSTIFVIGAAGKVGKRLVALLAARGDRVLAMYRKAEQAEPLRASGAQPVEGDLTRLDAAGLASLAQGSDAIVFTAGAGGAGMEITNAIDGRGLECAVEAARLAGIRRFVLVSAFPEAGRGKEPSEGFENYMRVKKLADAHLVASGLEWIILRPGTLSDEPGSGRVAADLALPYGTVTRDDVATTIAEILAVPKLHHIIIELTNGQEPIADAIKRLAKG
jgi:uncharacterized protein YbjT (DUF2867 family)